MAKKPTTLPELMIGDMVTIHPSVVWGKPPTILGEVVTNSGGVVNAQTSYGWCVFCENTPTVKVWDFVSRPKPDSFDKLWSGDLIAFQSLGQTLSGYVKWFEPGGIKVTTPNFEYSLDSSSVWSFISRIGVDYDFDDVVCGIPVHQETRQIVYREMTIPDSPLSLLEEVHKRAESHVRRTCREWPYEHKLMGKHDAFTGENIYWFEKVRK